MNKFFLDKLYIEQQSCPNCVSTQIVENWFYELLGILFPDIKRNKFNTQEAFEQHVENIKVQLLQILKYTPTTNEKADYITSDLFDSLNDIHNKLEQDISSIFDGDPAAKSRREVIKTYPGFFAIAAHRIANSLYSLEVPLLPRIISEYAHSKTGIDIHPGATIGNFFCIDHGTGIVIGETTTIGDHVKIYQGVTLGALSVDKKDAQIKRHPTIEDNVVLYAGATILGGETIIGNGSIIGGNVWLTHSTPPLSKVYYQAQMAHENGSIDTITYKSKST